MSDKSQRTEQATARRLERARREGQFPAAKQFVAAAQFLAFVAMIGKWGGTWLENSRQTMRFLLQRAFAPDFQISDLVRLAGDMVLHTFFPLIIAGALLMGVTLAAQLVVTRFGLTVKRLAPDFARLNPMSRLRE